MGNFLLLILLGNIMPSNIVHLQGGNRASRLGQAAGGLLARFLQDRAEKQEEQRFQDAVISASKAENKQDFLNEMAKHAKNLDQLKAIQELANSRYPDAEFDIINVTLPDGSTQQMSIQKGRSLESELAARGMTLGTQPSSSAKTFISSDRNRTGFFIPGQEPPGWTPIDQFNSNRDFGQRQIEEYGRNTRAAMEEASRNTRADKENAAKAKESSATVAGLSYEALKKVMNNQRNNLPDFTGMTAAERRIAQNALTSKATELAVGSLAANPKWWTASPEEQARILNDAIGAFEKNSAGGGNGPSEDVVNALKSHPKGTKVIDEKGKSWILDVSGQPVQIAQ